jgi:hypothetical protein
MKHRDHFTMRAVAALTVFCLSAAAITAKAEDLTYYKGSSLYRAKNTMSGNLVQTVFYNYGLVGNTGEISGEWPIGTGDEYVGDVSPLVGVQFIHPSGDTLISVTTSDGPRQNSDGPSGGGTFWGFEPLPGFNAATVVGENPVVAISNQKRSWPSYWPDKEYTDALDANWVKDITDPGWGGSWNGYFGKNVFNADQETYFQMDDNADGEWFQRQDSLGNVYYYYPSNDDSTRRGLGLRVTVRGLQWSHFLAQDCIFWLYEITNVSSYTYDKVCFGMVVGTLAGGREDSEDDLAYFDLSNDITYSWDSDDQGSPDWVPVRAGEVNVGYAGYAFLESPGNPHDGIDNDGDSESGSPVLTAQLLYDMTRPIVMNPGREIVMIDYETYERTVTTFPSDSLVYYIHDRRHVLFPSDTVVEDGHNGLDDNLNGLIDERYDSTHIGHKYKDYIGGGGLTDLLIDEGRNDGIDNDGDWDPLMDDVGADGVAGTRDTGEADGLPTNGEPNFDKTDVNESDQIGLTSFDYFSPPGQVRMRDDPALWTRMVPGHFDVVSGQAEDGDFIYGSGYFPLQPGQTERFSMALLFGEDLPDITDNKITVQQIYDENYNFARPPEKPTLWAVPGDGRVTLYWDGRASESSFEPICHCYDFEGYKIYRSTDPSFNEVFTVTDGMGRLVFYNPIAQFDLKDDYAYVDTSYYRHVDSAVCGLVPIDTLPGIMIRDSILFDTVWCYRDTLLQDSVGRSVEGFFPIIRNSVIYYLGSNTGIVHSWTDTTVENGQTYYYAVCAYDRGDFGRGILPAENSKTIVMDASGAVTLDINTAVVTPRAPAAGYEEPLISSLVHVSGTSTGAVTTQVVDPRLVHDNCSYNFTFANVPDSVSETRTVYSVTRDSLGIDSILIADEPLVPESNLITEASRFSSYYESLFNQIQGLYDPAVYFRVAGTQQFDGQLAYMLIPRDTVLISEISGWEDTTRRLLNYSFAPINIGELQLIGKRIPADYRVEWYGENVYTSLPLSDIPTVDVNFTVTNINGNRLVPFTFFENSASVNGRVDASDAIILYDSLAGRLEICWAISFQKRVATGDTIKPDSGDVLVLHVYQPYTSRDVFSYSTRAARVNSGAVDLDRIRVYPNPYVGVSAQEPTNLYNEGRGERRITFTHLPDECTIRIYTVRGDLVKSIEHQTTIDDGHENWDMRSRDGLNIAYGVYLYHIDSPYGEKLGRFAVIK